MSASSNAGPGADYFIKSVPGHLHGFSGILPQSAAFTIPASMTNEILLQGWISEYPESFNHTLIFTGCLTPYVRK